MFTLSKVFVELIKGDLYPISLLIDIGQGEKIAKRKYKKANMSPMHFTRELRKNWLSEGLELQGIFGVGTIEGFLNPIF